MRTESDRQPRWIRRCSDGSCVEVARDGTNVLVRNSQHSDGPILRLTREQWGAFRAGVIAGEFG